MTLVMIGGLIGAVASAVVLPALRRWFFGRD